ncbi:MAG: flagellar basal body-associated protein FliL, partial [Ketobacter sp.]
LEGKEMLKETALSEIVSALQDEGEPAEIEDILFTSFIVD